MNEGQTVEENEIDTQGKVAMVLKDMKRKWNELGGRYLDGMRLGLVAFNISDVLAVDVAGTLSIIESEGGISNVPVGEEAFKESL